ncbi:hypothetical protein CE195_03060 [Sodalis-like symbiont of Philaenus spumarius]|nr:hypothetical protein CE195_03060 [Sodalis-like symbiont of Philaenus spumarius]
MATCPSPTKRERFRCQCCHRVFQLTYHYEARKPGVKEQIVDMAFNGAGVPNASGVSAVTVYSSLPTTMKRESRALKSRSLRWPSTVPVFAIPPER